MYKAIFGSEVAELCLLYIVKYGEGGIRLIANAFKLSPGAVQRQLEKLEAGGILVSQIAGNTRRFSINPSLPIKSELTDLLEKILSILPEAEAGKFCCEPRRTGRPGNTLSDQ